MMASTVKNGNDRLRKGNRRRSVCISVWIIKSHQLQTFEAYEYDFLPKKILFLLSLSFCPPSEPAFVPCISKSQSSRLAISLVSHFRFRLHAVRLFFPVNVRSTKQGLILSSVRSKLQFGSALRMRLHWKVCPASARLSKW